MTDAEQSVEVSASSENPQTEDVNQEESSASPADTADKPRNRVQERINELTRDKYELRSGLEDVRKENQELKSRLSQLEQPQKTVTEPRPDDFPDDLEYQRAREMYITEKAKMEALSEFEKRQEERQQASEADRQRETLQRKRSDFARQVQEKSEHYENLADVVFTAPIDEGPVTDYVLNSDKGVDVAYYLGTHLDQLDQINQMDQLTATRELARIEARLADAQPKTVTNAPDPITPLGNSEVVSKDPDNMPMDEWLAWRRENKAVR